MNTPDTRLVQQAQAQGLLPPDAARQLPDQDSTSWVLAGLSFIGAQLVLLPFLLLLGALSYEFFYEGPGAFLTSALLLAGSVAVLRARHAGMFVHQLAFSCLIAGLVLWGAGNDAMHVLDHVHGFDAMLLQLIALALLAAALAPLLWVRRLLGMGATVLVLLLSFGQAFDQHGDALMALGVGLPSRTLIPLTLLWAAWCALEPRLGHWRGARLTSALADGAGVALLLWAAFQAGQSHFSAAVWGMRLPGSAEWVQQMLPQGTGLRWWLLVHRPLIVQWVLLLLGAVWLARHWRLRWQQPASPLLAMSVLTLAVGGWAMPQLGAIGLMGLVALGTGRWRTLLLVCVALLANLSGFYYTLHWPLQQKAALLGAVGAALALGLWLLRQRRQRAVAAGALGTDGTAPAPAAWQRWGGAVVALAGVLALGLVQWDVSQKERVIAQGQIIYVPLRPADPRSLMQGDYMALDFDLPHQLVGELRANRSSAGQVLVQARVDARGVATVTGIHPAGQATPEGHVLLPVRFIKGRWSLVTDAFFFPEGLGRPFERASFGEFRALPNGQALLVGLADEHLNTIRPGPPPDR